MSEDFSVEVEEATILGEISTTLSLACPDSVGVISAQQRAFVWKQQMEDGTTRDYLVAVRFIPKD